MNDFKDKVAVITGAASGIGRALAQRCVQEQAKVVLADIETEPLFQAEKDLRNIGGNVLAVPTDVSKIEDMQALAKKTLDTYGAVHLLFNNAGVMGGRAIWKSTTNDWKWILGVNLWGVIHGIQVFVPIMLKQDTECHIVNTGSAAGLIFGTGGGVYKVSKHGVVSLTETLYGELAIAGPKIGVSLLCPGYVRTGIMRSERNRPIELQNPPSVKQIAARDDEMVKAAGRLDTRGMLPDEVAPIVFKAIREKRFYIFTHPEWKELVRHRMETILMDRNPSPPPKKPRTN